MEKESIATPWPSPFSEKEISQICEIEKKTFDWAVDEDALDRLRKRLNSSQSVVAVARGTEDQIIGYVVGVPSVDMESILSEHDPAFSSANDSLYIDTFAIDKESRGNVKQVNDLLRELAVQAQEKGYHKLSLHIPTNHINLYTLLFKDAVEIQRTLTNWFGSGEDHYYIEITI